MAWFIYKSYPACAIMAFEVESFTIDSMIKGGHVYKNFWLSSKCCAIAAMKQVVKDLLGRHPAVAKPAEMYTL